MDAAVAIEIAADEDRASRRAPDAALGGALLEACSHAVLKGDCVAAPAPASAIAVVTWASDGLAAHVRVVVRSAIREDDVRFSKSDAVIERYRALGLVVAFLAGEARQVADTTATLAHSVVDTSPRAPSVPAPPRKRIFWFDLAPLTGPALDEGSWQLGGLFRGAWAARPWLFVEAEGRAGIRPKDSAALATQAASGTIGGGVAWRAGWFRAAFRVAGGLEWLRASVVAAPDEDARSIVVGLVRIGVEGAARLSAAVTLFVGVDVGAHLRVPVRIRSTEIGFFPTFAPAIVLGVRVTP
ncbi:hypothetical protein BH09MYX1_BH09MYX1_41700 [soil metagenome]